MIGTDVPAKNNNGLIKALEPASGSGVMLMSMCQEVIEGQGIEALANWSLTAIDLDSYCARMTSAQILANCFIHQVTLGELVVYQGNALLAEENLTLVIHLTASHIEPEKVIPATHPARIEAIKEAVASNEQGQLELWG